MSELRYFDESRSRPSKNRGTSEVLEGQGSRWGRGACSCMGRQNVVLPISSGQSAHCSPFMITPSFRLATAEQPSTWCNQGRSSAHGSTFVVGYNEDTKLCSQRPPPTGWRLLFFLLLLLHVRLFLLLPSSVRGAAHKPHSNTCSNYHRLDEVLRSDTLPPEHG